MRPLRLLLDAQLVDHLLDHARVDQTYELVDDEPVADGQHCGHGLHLERVRELGVQLHVDGRQVDVVLGSDQLGELRGEDVARLAPVRVEVDDHRVVGVHHLEHEVVVVVYVDDLVHVDGVREAGATPQAHLERFQRIPAGNRVR